MMVWLASVGAHPSAIAASGALLLLPLRTLRREAVAGQINRLAVHKEKDGTASALSVASRAPRTSKPDRYQAIGGARG